MPPGLHRLQRHAQRLKLHPQVLLFIPIGEEVAQAEPFAQLLENPQSRPALAQRFDDRLADEDLPADDGERVVPLQVARIGQDHVGEPGRVVHADVHGHDQIEFRHRRQRLLSLRQGVHRVLPVDEPTARLVGLTGDDVVAQFLEDAQLEGDKGIFPRHAVEPRRFFWNGLLRLWNVSGDVSPLRCYS